MHIKSPALTQVRQRNVANAVASGRIEGIVPTKELEQNLSDYVSGKKILPNCWKKLNNAMSRYDADDTYCYPGTDVLRNKAEIIDAKELDAYEGELSTLRSIQILESPVPGKFDLEHLNLFLRRLKKIESSSEI